MNDLFSKKSGHTEWMNTAKLTLRRKDASFFGNLTPVSALQDVCLRNVRLSSQLSSSDSCLTTLVRGLVTIFGTSELSRQIIHNGTATSTASLGDSGQQQQRQWRRCAGQLKGSRVLKWASVLIDWRTIKEKNFRLWSFPPFAIC